MLSSLLLMCGQREFHSMKQRASLSKFAHSFRRDEWFELCDCCLRLVKVYIDATKRATVLLDRHDELWRDDHVDRAVVRHEDCYGDRCWKHWNVPIRVQVGGLLSFLCRTLYAAKADPPQH